MDTKDTYVFEVVIGDTNDEMSESFNPKNPEDVTGFEENIREVLETDFEVVYVKLRSVTTNF